LGAAVTCVIRDAEIAEPDICGAGTRTFNEGFIDIAGRPPEWLRTFFD
jgi:hypothetical protein